MTERTEAEEVPGGPPSLWRNRDFGLLWGSQTLSDVGGYVSILAFPLLVLSLTGSAVQAGAVGTVAAVVRAAVRLPAGALVDRWNRRTVMLVSDAVRLLAFAVLGGSLLLGGTPLALVYAVALVEAVFDVFFSPAESAAIRHVVPAQQLTEAFARNEVRSYTASLVGPPLGGLLYAIARAVPFLVDALTFAVSFGAVALIRKPLQSVRELAEPTSARADVVEGMRFFFGDPFLRASLILAAPLNAGFTGVLFTVVVVLRQSGWSSGIIGVTQGAASVGGLLGALAATRMVHRLSPRSIIVSITWAAVVLFATGALLVHGPAVAAPLAVAFFAAPAANAVLFSYQMAVTPDRLQARATAVLMLVATGLASLAPLLAGVLIDSAGGAATMLFFSAVAVVAALTATFAPGIRQMRPLNEIGVAG